MAIARTLNHSGFPMMPPGFTGPSDRVVSNTGNIALIAAGKDLEIGVTDTVDDVTIMADSFMDLESADSMNVFANGTMTITTYDQMEIASQKDILIDTPKKLTLDVDPNATSGLFITGLKYGASQAAAGAVVGEVWVDTAGGFLRIGI